MGYQFKGFLTKNKTLAEAAVKKWPFCIMKEMSDQMVGFVVKVPCEYDVHPSVPEEEYEAVLEQCADVEENLASFARQFPDDTVVYVFIDCFGGVCDHTGFHILGGEVVKTFVHSRTGAV